jgi:LCP family protein required for cell wall assembly
MDPMPAMIPRVPSRPRSHGGRHPRSHALLAAAIVTLVTVASWRLVHGNPDGTIAIGIPRGTRTPTAGPVIPVSAPPAVLGARSATSPSAPSPSARTPSAVAPVAPLTAPNGAPWPAAIAFTSSITVPDHVVFVLVVGSDARPGQDPLRSRADSIHLLAADPGSGQGTVLGFPRDALVDIPGHGRRKINDSLALGGPDLAAATVRQLTGLPVHYYAVVGMDGFRHLVDDMGGFDVPVPYRMDDRSSGARFEAGWHRMGGDGALAFARNRKDTPHGDLSRSLNQGTLILSGLARMRATVADDGGVMGWVGVLLRHVHLDVPLGEIPRLAALARRLDPERVTNVVAPGAPGWSGGASVVHLDPAGCAALFDDIRADGVVGQAVPTTTTSAVPTTTTTTTTTGAADETAGEDVPMRGRPILSAVVARLV